MTRGHFNGKMYTSELPCPCKSSALHNLLICLMVEPSTHSFIGLFILQIRKHVLYVKGCASHREHRDTEDAIPALRKTTARD